MLMSDFVDWLIPDIPKDISLQIHKEKILMVELFMKEEQGRRLALRENHQHHQPLQDNCCTSPSSAQTAPRSPLSPPLTLTLLGSNSQSACDFYIQLLSYLGISTATRRRFCSSVHIEDKEEGLQRGTERQNTPSSHINRTACGAVSIT
ncbi:hypothetical protein WMY93_013024 [Mugilogobius chulae]|uniref:Uncharacterized protein n=1 Tax=Mugilogobius chulae TaxID=88201 RepID=A0AAW0NZ51_9GOBI